MPNDNYKSLTLSGYEDFAALYAKNTSEFHPKDYARKFITHLPKKGKILDIGCGPGRDAKVFSDQGFEVLGIDFSPKMISLAKKSCPKAQFIVMDMEMLNFQQDTFDGVWASASFLHLKKENLLNAFTKVYALLKMNGIFYLSVKKGVGEFIANDERYENTQKFWSFFEEEEIVAILRSAKFEILESDCNEPQSTYHTHPLIQVLCKRGIITS